MLELVIFVQVGIMNTQIFVVLVRTKKSQIEQL